MLPNNDNANKIVLWDLDGTLFDIRHRLQYVTEKPKNWKAFYDEIPFDEPFVTMTNLWRWYAHYGYQQLILTGRPEHTRPVSLKMIHDFVDAEFDDSNLLMRPNDDFQSDVEFKVAVVQHLIDIGKTIEIAYDDKHEIVDAYIYRCGIDAVRCQNGSLIIGEIDDPDSCSLE